MSRDKIFIYQIFTRLMGNANSVNIPNGSVEENGTGKFNDITVSLLEELKKSGYTHVWYIGVLAHASKTDYTDFGIPFEFPEIIKGNAGSPYAIRDYYDLDPDLAENVHSRFEEFDDLVNRTHKAGLKVVIDFVPNHLARNYKSISRPSNVKEFGEDDYTNVAFNKDNNFYYLPGQSLDLSLLKNDNDEIKYIECPAKVTGNDSFTNKPSKYDWYETIKLNYGLDYLNGKQTYFDPIPDTWNKMKDILVFWCNKRVDAFRCDMAEMVPLDFWYWVIPQIKAEFPKIIFFAENYNPAEYRNFLANNAFDYLYDKVGLYDILRDVASGYRPASDITFALRQVGDIQHRMINFMENHDEQRLASDYFLKNGLKGIAAMMVTACVGVNPVMVYFGQELGERGMDEEGFSGKDGRTTIFDYWSVDTVRRWNNNGKWNDELLTKDEIKLRKFYSKLIKLCNSEKAISGGLFYDLMYANYDNKLFNSIKQFAFLRGNKDDLLLVVVNFSDTQEDITINIPPEAFNYFGKDSTEVIVATSLLIKKNINIPFSVSKPLMVSISANSGDVYKITFL